jgi:disulfide bond formation protein DsbB
MTIISLYNQRKWGFDRLLIVFWIASLSILVFSFYQQYIGKVEPCSLCKLQRYIYFSIALLAPVGLIQSYNSPIRYALSIIFLIGFCFAAYHTLVQFGWLADRCTMTQKIENLNDFMNMLEQPKTSCANISWKFLGLSASIYNTIFSLIALITLNFKNIKRLIHV